jgi:lipid-binding SYLF domain-containing protein
MWTYSATDAKTMDTDVDLALKEFTENISGSEAFVNTAKGILVFPALYKAGFLAGVEYGNGTLKIAGKTVEYYNFLGLSVGAQIGVQKTSLLIMFMKDIALEKFRASKGFDLGLVANATVITVGANTALDTTKLGQPILAFAFDQRGLMAGITLEGSKFTKRDPE